MPESRRRFHWFAVAVGAVLLLLAAACGTETVEVPGETVVVEKEIIKTVEVPGETVVVEKEVVKTIEVPGQTVVKEVVKEVMVPGETVVVEKEVVKTVEVPGQTVVVEAERFTTNVWGEVVEIPRYGGTIPAAVIGLPETFDPYYNSRESMVLYSPFVLEAMGDVDWSLPRDNRAVPHVQIRRYELRRSRAGRRLVHLFRPSHIHLRHPRGRPVAQQGPYERP